MGALTVLKEAFSAFNSMVNYVEYDEEENFSKVVDEYKKSNPNESKFMDKFLKAVELEKEERAKLEEKIQEIDVENEVKFENKLNEKIKVEETVVGKIKEKNIVEIDEEEKGERIK